jgi:hypothetical protein
MEYERLLASFVAALAVTQLAHMVLEATDIRKKLPVFTRSLAWHGLLFVIVTGLLFGLFITIGASIQTLLTVSIFFMVLGYGYSAVSLDAAYNQLARIIKPPKR